jgi:NAD(P)-dependent dehydrogenase (short-subunit alcohol dehydrogenase family)
MPAEQVGPFGAETLIGRVGQPAELAPAYGLRASPESSYITDERIGVTGDADALTRQRRQTAAAACRRLSG